MKSRFTVSRTGEAGVLYGDVFKIKRKILVQTIRSAVLAVEREEKNDRNKRKPTPTK